MANLINQLYSRAATTTITSPTQISGLIAWYDFSDISTLWKDTGRTSAVTADGDSIAGVTDKSSVAQHLSQATAGSRPLYKTAIVNSRAIARFDGVDDALVTANYTQAQPFSVVVIAQKRALSATTKTLVNPARAAFSGYVGQHVSVSGHLALYAGTFLDTGAAFANTTQHFIAGIVNGASSSIQLDATKTSGDAGAGAVVADNLTVGADASGGTNSGDYDICEVMQYSVALTAGNVASLRAYAQTRWATP